MGEHESRHTDLLLEVPRQRADEGEGVLVYVLLEHQSSVDPWMARRLLRYVDRVWSRWEADHPGARKLPVVLPWVIYQGERPWSAPTTLHGIVGWGASPSLEAPLSVHVPGFAFRMLDLSRTADAELGGDGVALALKVMKHIRARDFERRFALLAADLRTLLSEPAGLQLLVSLVHYALIVRDSLDIEHVVRVVERATGPKIGAEVMTVAEQLREEGRQEGLLRGREEGREEGRRLAEIGILVRQLARRFGALEQRAIELLEASSEAERLAWGERLLDAATLHEVFGDAWEH